MILVCTNADCSNPIASDRRKYCSPICQLSAAYKKSTEWHSRRKVQEIIEQEKNVPPDTKRYSIKEGGCLWEKFSDDSLLSRRNPTGSTYVERVIALVDLFKEYGISMSKDSKVSKLAVFQESAGNDIDGNCIYTYSISDSSYIESDQRVDPILMVGESLESLEQTLIEMLIAIRNGVVTCESSN